MDKIDSKARVHANVLFSKSFFTLPDGRVSRVTSAEVPKSMKPEKRVISPWSK